MVSTKTYCKSLFTEVHLFFEPKGYGIREVGEEVDDATASRRNVGFAKEHTDQEGQRDGRAGEHQQDEDDDRHIGVDQYLSLFEQHGKDDNRNEHGYETGEKPRHPVNRIAQTHNLKQTKNNATLYR